MIKALHAVNFRRHSELDLRFDDDRQLILIAGANGTGKSTILEAITFALWGEGRHGRRNLDSLVRRGAELEGMSVELTFTVDQDEYRVHRRRDGKAVTAVLYANDTPLVEGPLAVTAEITGLLGMDSTGFRLAVIAQQKDLDGLASLRPAERAQMITRLLRLDALTAARNAASVKFRSERDVATALRGEDPGPLQLELAAARVDATSAETELAASRRSLESLQATLSDGDHIDSEWERRLRDVARLEGSLAQTAARRAAVETELVDLVVPEVVGDDHDVVALTEQAAAVEREIAQAESREQTSRQRAVALEELELVRARMVDIRATYPGDEPCMEDLLAGLESARRLVSSLSEQTDMVTLRLGSLRGRQEDLNRQLAATASLGAECDSCGQQISEEHRHDQSERLEKALAALLDEIATAEDQYAQVAAASDAAATQATDAKNALDQARATAATRSRFDEELTELTRREKIYADQVERIESAPVDVDVLYAERARLTSAVAQAAEYQRQLRARDAAITRRMSLTTQIEDLAVDEANALEQLSLVRPDQELADSYAQRRKTLAALDAEREMTHHWETAHALASAKVSHLENALADARARQERRSGHEAAAVNASAAGRLLGEVSERLGAQIRPSLEGAVATLLSTMSEGRFSAVQISDEYAISVQDDGKFRPLGELSGGEVDLVALAVRLALAQIVSDRHGSGGAGFLILDECFASQDAQRRQSILNALRTLRDVYSQIFLISHVENIEDSADVVVQVSTDSDRQETEVSVS